MGKWAKPHPRKNWVKRACEVCETEFEVPQWKVNQGKGKYCSKPCYRLGSRKQEGLEYDGKWFAQDPRTGYFWHRTPDKTSVSLHKYKWEQHHKMPTPEGCVIHHKDHDNTNNDIENLECVSESWHARYHLQKRIEEGYDWRPSLEKAREAAKEWHRSEEGREWHRQHAYKSLHKQ